MLVGEGAWAGPDDSMLRGFEHPIQDGHAMLDHSWDEGPQHFGMTHLISVPSIKAIKIKMIAVCILCASCTHLKASLYGEGHEHYSLTQMELWRRPW